MDVIKLFAKNEKNKTNLEHLTQVSENIQSGYKEGIWHRQNVAC